MPTSVVLETVHIVVVWVHKNVQRLAPARLVFRRAEQTSSSSAVYSRRFGSRDLTVEREMWTLVR